MLAFSSSTDSQVGGGPAYVHEEHNWSTKEQDRVADGLSRLIESANAPIFGVDLSGMVTE